MTCQYGALFALPLHHDKAEMLRPPTEDVGNKQNAHRKIANVAVRFNVNEPSHGVLKASNVAHGKPFGRDREIRCSHLRYSVVDLTYLRDFKSCVTQKSYAHRKKSICNRSRIVRS